MSDDEGEAVAGFRATPGGATVRFAAAQATIIRDLVGQIAELVADDMPDDGGTAGTGSAAELASQLGVSDATELPEDPVLARLLPDAYSDDPEASGEFRRYTEQGLRSAKVAAARTVLATLPAFGREDPAVRAGGPGMAPCTQRCQARAQRAPRNHR